MLIAALLVLLRYAAGTRELALLDPIEESPVPREYPEPPKMPTLVDARERYLGYQEIDAMGARNARCHVGWFSLQALLDEDLTISYIDQELGNAPPVVTLRYANSNIALESQP